MSTALAVVALLLALASLLLAASALRRSTEAQRLRRRQSAAAADLPEDTHGLRQEVAALRAENAHALKHLAVVRYDAFGDMGGHLSWSLAVLDDHGNGSVLTSIHGRNDARTYAKQVTGWTCAQQLSPEEQEAVDAARP
ncbi:MAG TPA: DUF4446 family protein [Marmoricola sp.]|nr:DUF4446 family protein [Marmoricola sp.]